MGESRGQETWFGLVTFHNHKILFLIPENDPFFIDGVIFSFYSLHNSDNIIIFAKDLKLKDYGYNKTQSWRPHNVR